MLSGCKISRRPKGGSLTELKLWWGGGWPVGHKISQWQQACGYLLACQEEKSFLSQTEQFWSTLQIAAKQTPLLGSDSEDVVSFALGISCM